MLTANNRRNSEAFLARLAEKDPTLVKAYEEWLAHPVTVALAGQLEILREGDASGPHEPGIPGILSLAACGARARVWETVHALMFNLITYAETSSPRQEEDVASRPDFL